MRTIKKKLNSQRGASLTFALLLFLVCAVIGSVVLVAGTAASGRLAGLADYEQRFYAVNSAAELLAEEITAGKTTVTMTRTTKTPITKTYDKDLLLIREEQDLENITYTYSELQILASVNEAGSSFHGVGNATKKLLEDLATKLIKETGKEEEEREPEDIWNSIPTQTASYEYSISANDKPALAVDIEADMTIFGAGSDRFSAELALDITNNVGDQKYCVHMVFASDMINRKAYSTGSPTMTLDTSKTTNPVDSYVEVTTPVYNEETGETTNVTENVFTGRTEYWVRTVEEQRKPTVKWTLQSVSVSEAAA